MKKLFKNGITDEIVVMSVVISAFFPWAVSFVLIAAICIFILAYPRTRRIIVSDKGSVFLLPFVPVVLIPPLCHRNWLGLMSGVGILLIFVLFIYFKNVLTAEMAEKSFNIICVLSIFAAIYATVEKMVYLRFPTLAEGSVALPSNDELRAASVFGNPNLYSSVICFAILISVHMLIERKGDFKLYFITIAANLIGMMLCGSLMGMIELFVGLIAIIALKRKYILLSALVALCLAGGITIVCIPQLLPRLIDANHSFEMRIHIWELSAIMFKKAPLFGRGILSYMVFSSDYIGMEHLLGLSEIRVTTNAHNIVIDGLLSFGIIGMLIVTFYFFMVFVPLIGEYLKRNRTFSSLAIATVTGALAHGMFDVTMAWPQVAVLLLLILASGTLKGSPDNNAGITVVRHTS